MQHDLGVAKEEGVGDGKIGAVQALVMATSAGKVMAQVEDAMGMGEG
jgi:hypothetical protein